MFIRIIDLSPLFVSRGCKIRLIFLIIKIMEEVFFGKVIDHTLPGRRPRYLSVILSERGGRLQTREKRYEYGIQ